MHQAGYSVEAIKLYVHQIYLLNLCVVVIDPEA
jgi:hypothetical protein